MSKYLLEVLREALKFNPKYQLKIMDDGYYLFFGTTVVVNLHSEFYNSITVCDTGIVIGTTYGKTIILLSDEYVIQS